MGIVEDIGEATLKLMDRVYRLVIAAAEQGRRISLSIYPYFERRGIDYRDYMVLKVQVAALGFLFSSVLFVFGFLGARFYALLLLLGGYSLYLIPKLREHFPRDYNAYRDFFLGYLGVAALLVMVKTAKPVSNPFFPNLHLVVLSIVYIVLFSYFFKRRYGRSYTYGRVIQGGSIARVKLNYDIRASVKPGIVNLPNGVAAKRGDVVVVEVEKSPFNLLGRRAVGILKVAQRGGNPSPRVHRSMNTAGLECGWIAVKASEAMEKIRIGQVLEIICESREKTEDVELWLEMSGHELLAKKTKEDGVYYYVKRRR